MRQPLLKDRVWSRREIEGEIANGRKIIILDGQVIKADAWLAYHPGGDKAILHMVGRDGTDEIRALHSPEAQAHMRKFVIGRIEGRWENFTPPIQGGTFRSLPPSESAQPVVEGEPSDCSSTSSSPAQSSVFDLQEGLRQRSSSTSSISSLSLPETSDAKTRTVSDITDAQREADLAKYPSLSPSSQTAIISKYRDLDVRLRAAGLYNCNYAAYGWELSRYAALFVGFLLFLKSGWIIPSALCLGAFWHQLAFTAHDAGHMGITHNFQIDTCIGIFVADFLGGLSIGWWKRNHNVHHIVTNSPEHDPDIEHMPFFAISHRFFDSLRSTYYDRTMDFDKVAQWAVRHQHYLYYPLLFLGRINLYRLSWEYLLSPTQAPRKGPAWWHRYLEITGQIFFWTWLGYFTIYRSIPTVGQRVLFFVISHVVTGPLHVQITLSHFAMSTSDLGVAESFPQRMLRTTMDVDCPRWLDFFHGGLQFQVVHHLFPRIPRHNLRAAQKYVIEFCNDTGIPYTIYGFTKGNCEVLSRLEEVAKQVEIYEECRKHAAENLMAGEDAF